MMLGQDDLVPPPYPTSIFFSSDFGNSHDLAGLGLGRHVRPMAMLLPLVDYDVLYGFLQMTQCEDILATVNRW